MFVLYDSILKIMFQDLLINSHFLIFSQRNKLKTKVEIERQSRLPIESEKFIWNSE